jgi:hypothetical protein
MAFFLKMNVLIHYVHICIPKLTAIWLKVTIYLALTSGEKKIFFRHCFVHNSLKSWVSLFDSRGLILPKQKKNNICKF